MNKPIAIVFTLAAILLCGIPGVLMVTGRLDMGGEGPEMTYLCGGILILLPIVLAIASFSNIGESMKEVVNTGCLTIVIFAVVSPILGFLIYGVIHAGDYDKEEMRDAWAACSSATGEPSDALISGKVYEIGTINSSPPNLEFTETNTRAASSRYKYLDDEYKNFTKNLSRASAVLCAEVETDLLQTCNYPGFIYSAYSTEVHLTLLAWPSKELIAQTTLLGEPPEYFGRACPTVVLHESDEKFRNVYAPVNLDGWLDQFVATTK